MIEKLWMAMSFWDIAYFIMACATFAALAIFSESLEEDKKPGILVASILISVLWPIAWVVMLFVVIFVVVSDIVAALFKKAKR